MMVVVVHCLSDLLGTVSIHSCQISTKLVNALFCHALAYTQVHLILHHKGSQLMISLMCAEQHYKAGCLVMLFTLLVP